MEENKMKDKTFLRGSLEDFGLVEVLQVVEMRVLTGLMRLKDDQGRLGFVYLDHGKIINCFEVASDALTLGDIFQQLGMATYEQVEFGSSRQLQSIFGRNIGERLIAMHIIDEKQLNEALRTKALWTIRELGLWSKGTYEYIDHSHPRFFLPDGEQPLDLSIMRVAMELVRFVDEWDQLYKFLPNGLHTMLQIAPVVTHLVVDARLVEILSQVNLHSWVRKIATGMRQPELVVARDLATLVQQGLLLPMAQDERHVVIRVVEEPLTAQNLTTIMLALTTLSTKYWLIAKGRFADLIEYTQTHNERFAEEAHVVITKIMHNSPMNMDWRIDLSAPSVAEALITTIDGITQARTRLEKAKLENQAKVQEIKQAEQRSAYEQEMAALEREKQQLEIERQRLEVLEKSLEIQKKGIEYAMELANRIVDTLHPTADPATRAMEIRTLLPDLIQLQNVRGLELLLIQNEKQGKEL